MTDQLPPPIPADEAARLARLKQYAILDTPPTEAFNRIARLASNLIDTPMALISLIDDSRQWFKARVGVEVTETPRDIAFCAYAILGDDVMEVSDAQDDQRFHSNPLVTGPMGIRFYAGMPLQVEGGEKLGTLCVIDTKPRQLSAREREILKDLAALVSDEIELHYAGNRVLRELEAHTRLQGSLVAAYRGKSEFLAKMSHELRTPLNAIIGFSDLIETSSREATSRDYARDVRRAGEHLLTLVNNILDLSKAEADRIDLDLHEIDLAMTLEEAMRMTRTLAEQRGVGLPPPLIRSGPKLRADATRLRQVFLNILSNAVKFTPRGGQVTVSFGNGGPMVWVTIRDTGVGIAPEDLVKVLAPFGQVHHNRTGLETEGTGLGLPIAKSLVERHGGTLSIDSMPGMGTSITLRLPVAGPSALPE